MYMCGTVGLDAREGIGSQRAGVISSYDLPICILEKELESSGREANMFSHQAISIAPFSEI